MVLKVTVRFSRSRNNTTAAALKRLTLLEDLHSNAVEFGTGASKNRKQFVHVFHASVLHCLLDLLDVGHGDLGHILSDVDGKRV